MSIHGFLASGPQRAKQRIILAHGAGAGMTSPFMEAIAGALGAQGLATSRFEFTYMAERRDGTSRRPPPRAIKLIDEFRAVLEQASQQHRKAKLVIGGKSMGGRVASMLADEAFAAGAIVGLVCLGYPFHPPGQPDKLRTAHLEAIKCPTLIVQGERDPFGSRDEVEAMRLSPAIKLCWIGDGDHDFGPRGASGFTRSGNLTAAAEAVAEFCAGLA